MIKLRKKHYAVNLYLIFLACMAGIVGLFGFRVYSHSEVTPMSVGQTILLSEMYTPGTIFDRKGEVIVAGNGDGLHWSTEETRKAFQQVLGLDIRSTLLSKTTVLGNCAWVFGTEDNRWGIHSLFHPADRKTGGSVRLTLDKRLQEYVAGLVCQNGHEKAYVIVSDYKTGKILAAYGDVFGKSMHPGSTMKPILAATALSLNPNLEDYVYNCVPANHSFSTEDGAVEINCAENAYHGELSMESAVAYNCNGYFISLMQQADHREMLEALKKWGFDTSVSYEQFMYWDHSFMKNSHSEIDYLMAAIGQANAYMTPAGLHFCTNALLNHGELAEPNWYSWKLSSPQGPWQKIEARGAKTVCDSAAADKVVSMMELVTEIGTGASFYLPGFAAKTGTAQKADEDGNLTGLCTVWTTGGLTDENTPYAVTVCLDDVDEYVGSAAAGKMAQSILIYITEGGE